MAAEPKIVDANALIDSSRLGPQPILVAALAALVMAVDGFDTQAITYIAPQIAKAWGISHDGMGYIFGAGLTGVLAGNLGLSPLAGRFGPKRLIVLCLAVIGVFTLLSATAESTGAMIVWRFFAGLGIGGSLPSAAALPGEFSPKSWRPIVVTLIFFGFALGQIAAGQTTKLLLAAHGWQSVLVVGAAFPLTLMVVIQLALPESLEFLINTGGDRARVLRILNGIRPQPALRGDVRLVAGRPGPRAVAVSELFRAGRLLGTAVNWTAMFINLGIYYFVQNWLTLFLVPLGMAQSQAITASTLVMWGSMVTPFSTGPLMRRFGAYPVIVGVFLGNMAVFLLMARLMEPPLAVPLIMACCCLIGFFVSSGQRCLCVLAVEFYPVALRPTGLGWLFGSGRAGAVLSSLAVGGLLQLGWHARTLYYGAALLPLIAAGCCLAMAWHYGAAGVEPPVEPASRTPREPAAAGGD